METYRTKGHCKGKDQEAALSHVLFFICSSVTSLHVDVKLSLRKHYFIMGLKHICTELQISSEQLTVGETEGNSFPVRKNKITRRKGTRWKKSL